MSSLSHSKHKEDSIDDRPARVPAGAAPDSGFNATAHTECTWFESSWDLLHGLDVIELHCSVQSTAARKPHTS
jgi:hypothetical protein